MGLEEDDEDSFVDIDNIPGTGSDQEGRIRGTGMVGKRVEVVTRSGRRVGGVVDTPVKTLPISVYHAHIFGFSTLSPPPSPKWDTLPWPCGAAGLFPPHAYPQGP